MNLNRKYIKVAAAAAMAAVIVVDSFWIIGLKRGVASLEGKISSMENNLLNQMSSMESTVVRQSDNMETILKKGNSLLSDADVRFKLKGNKIAVSVHAMPKALAESETVFVRLYAGESIYEKEADEDGRTEFLIDMAETVRPVVLMKSEAGIRQEALEETYTGYLFAADLYTVWGDEDGSVPWGLTTWLTHEGSELPFDPAEVEKAEYVIKPTGIPVDHGDGTAELAAPLVNPESENGENLFEDTDCERVETVMMNGSNRFHAGYYADLSEFGERKDGVEYAVYLCITTKDKTRFYTTEDSVSTFVSHENSSSTSCGYGRLVPVYPEKQADGK